MIHSIPRVMFPGHWLCSKDNMEIVPLPFCGGLTKKKSWQDSVRFLFEKML